MRAREIGYSEIAQVLESAEHWHLLSHVKPDGDTLGAACALYGAALARGKRVSWSGSSDVPVAYKFLPYIENYVKSGWIDLNSYGEGGKPLFGEPLFVCLDTSTQERTVGGLHALWKILNIDHHTDNTRYGTYCHIEPEISSTCEIIWDFMTTQGFEISKDIATGLYTGLMTDSGSFSYSSTNKRTHLAAADLLERGVEPSFVSLAVNGSRTIEGLHLWGRALAKVRRLGARDQIAFTYLTLSDFYETGASQSDTEFLVNQLLTLHGVEFTVLVIEDVLETRVSLRGVKGGVSAGKVARGLGGGGHELAAGITSKIALKEIIPLLLSKVEGEYAERDIFAE